MEGWQLKQRQSLPLDAKIIHTEKIIREWYEFWEGNVYISFSGGKDSTVMLHLIRKIYPNVKGVFCDTGLEYPEIREFVKTFDNITWLKPKLTFKQVIEKYGYPIISKEQSQYIYDIKNAKKQSTKDRRLYGDSKGRFKLSKKYHFLLEAPFKISSMCCNVMKKNPVKLFEKQTGLKPYIGTMAEESSLRKSSYLRNGGCNSFSNTRPISNPLAIWTYQDILRYIKENNIEIASVYGEILEKDGILNTTKCDRTGCVFCMYRCSIRRSP